MNTDALHGPRRTGSWRLLKLQRQSRQCCGCTIRPHGHRVGTFLKAVHHPSTPTKSCFENSVRRILDPLGVTRTKADVSGFGISRAVSSLTARRLPAKRQRIADGMKILLDISKESSDWFPPLKSALGGVSALIKHYEVLSSADGRRHNLHENS